MAKWTDEEKKILNVYDKKDELMEKLPGRSWEAIKEKRRSLYGSTTVVRVWEPSEIEILKMDISIKEMASKLVQRSTTSIATKRSSLGLSERKTIVNKWSDKELESLVFYYSNTGKRKISRNVWKILEFNKIKGSVSYFV